MKKKILIIVTVASLIGAGSWYFLQSEPMPKASTELTKQKPNPTQHTFYDVDFAQKMIIHNQQGILMADLVIVRSKNKELTETVRKIRNTQSKATSQYIAWLDTWGARYSDLSDFQEIDGHDMYPTHPGMAAAFEIANLRKLSGTSLDTSFLELEINHHEGAISMAGDILGQKVMYGGMVTLRDTVVERYREDLKILKKLQEK